MSDPRIKRGMASMPEKVGRMVRARTVMTLAASHDVRAVAGAAATAMRIAEEAFAGLRQQDCTVQREVAGLHCRIYCAHCCYKTVGVTPAEVFHLAEHVKATLCSEALAELKARLRDLDEKTRGMNPMERGRTRVPCALLVTGLCIAHAARPGSCRGFNSRDARACEQSVKQRNVAIPVYMPQYRIFSEAHLGLRQGLSDLGLQSTHLKLTAALRIALEMSDAVECWLAGAPIFRAAENT